MQEKKPFRFIRKWRDEYGNLRCLYEASFWEGPLEAGQQGRYVRRTLEDYVIDVWRNDKIVGKRVANTSPNVSYYGELCKMLGIPERLLD